MSAFFISNKTNQAMKIQALFKKNDNTVGVTFDDGQFLYLAYEIFLKNNLRTDKEITEEQYDRLIYENRIYFIKKAAFNFLGRRPHGEKELFLKLLKKGYEKKLIDEVIAELKEKKLLDDEHFAGLYIEENMHRKMWGRKKAEAELLKKGIGREIVKRVLDRLCADEDPLEQAKSALNKKIKTVKITEENREKVRMKLFRFLVARGFEYGVASEAVESMLDI